MGSSSETTASTVTTKTKTKTKMPSKNIIVVSGPSLAASRSRRGGTDKNYSLWGGGSTTVVSPDGSNGDVILAELECVPSVVKYKVNTENTNRPGRANKRKAEEELLDPEEDEKRKMRRNRNRLAAARCRQKRLDQIETLQVEVNNWELKNSLLAPGQGGARHGGGVSGVCPGPVQPGASQTSETREAGLPLPHTAHRQQHRGRRHRHSLQRHPQLQHPAGGEDRADPDQHPKPHQSVGASQDQLRPQHSELREPGETIDSDGPAQSQHSGSPHLPVTQHCTVTSCQHFIKNFII